MNNLSLMLIGNSGSGKSTLINVLINEYYKDINEDNKNSNIMIINTLKEQGIQYYRNEVKHLSNTVVLKRKKL